ncbi:hypothetical protein AX16_004112 [Volvariella volvacea WC 439]|nr:hypothetical protein AX16_004112 [Volvariella volvacea WC 439]
MPPLLQAGINKGQRKLSRMSSDLRGKNRTDGHLPDCTPSPIPQRADSVDFSVPDALLKGVLMTKVSEKKKKKVYFRVDPDEGQIVYESRKGGIVPIETIKEIRIAHNAHYHRIELGFPKDAEERWITLIYILEGTYKTLHMIADTKDVFELWKTTILKLHSIREGLKTGIGKVATRQAVWERQYWKGADKDGDQKLDYVNVESLCKRLNINMKREELQRLFSEADIEKRGYLDFPGFQRLVKELKRRPEIDALYGRICSENAGGFDFKAFERFMRNTQKSTLCQEELQTIFNAYTNPNSSSHDPDHYTPGQNPNELPGILSLDAFYNFLLSPENSPFSDAHGKIWQDMTKPIWDYYISASHNTYLVGHQLVGVSTVEGYIRALLHSCRSVELDIYDGDPEPVIYHGKTFTSKVSLREVCDAIARYSFVTSPYPVIISAEVHLGMEGQDKMVQVMSECFGDKLVSVPLDKPRPKIDVLPSPEDLKGKILLKAKNLYVVAQLAAIQAEKAKAVAADADFASSSSSSSEDEGGGVIGGLKSTWRKVRGKSTPSVSTTDLTATAATTSADGTVVASPTNKKIKMSLRLTALLVYTVGVKCHGLGGDLTYAPEHMFSLSENAANKLLKARDSLTELVKHNHEHLIRIYPKGMRVNSTNFEPQKFWAGGAQVVAINWQTFDLGYMINQAMFHRNGRSGYVLKPEALRDPSLSMLSKRTRHYLDVKIISAQQLPRPRDSTGQEIIEKSIVDPFVEVSLHIPDWNHSPFVRSDQSQQPTKSATGSGSTTSSATASSAGAKLVPSPPPGAVPPTISSARYKTQVIKDNGFNPFWNQEFNIPFDCVGDMKDLIFVQFSVRQKGKDDEDDEPLAVYCTSLGCLASGYPATYSIQSLFLLVIRSSILFPPSFHPAYSIGTHDQLSGHLPKRDFILGTR